jgi:hypothetical protein
MVFMRYLTKLHVQYVENLWEQIKYSFIMEEGILYSVAHVALEATTKQNANCKDIRFHNNCNCRVKTKIILAGGAQETRNLLISCPLENGNGTYF